MAGPGVNVAGAIGRGLAFGLGVGLAVGLMVGIGDGVAGPARLATTVGLGVAVLPAGNHDQQQAQDRAHSGQTSGSHPLLPDRLYRSHHDSPSTALVVWLGSADLVHSRGVGRDRGLVHARPDHRVHDFGVGVWTVTDQSPLDPSSSPVRGPNAVLPTMGDQYPVQGFGLMEQKLPS